MIRLYLQQTNVKSREVIENAKNAFEKRWLIHWSLYFFDTTAVLPLLGLRPYQSYDQNFPVKISVQTTA
jgi:hypothetical protein